ncbi:MAG: molybdenum cofactor biosynthesis protein MoaE [Cyclobacteriaceae bacterium]|nr:molybdenum cofactor biosynthesis protein MoaE [Cyclobacteriaceae bacterium]
MPDSSIFVHGAISADDIANAIQRLSEFQNIGAHSIFIGQVRSDAIEDQIVSAIDYAAYKEMAEQKALELISETVQTYQLNTAMVQHSLGMVKSGEICLFVLTASRHRKSSLEACAYLVERIKKELPVWGKEILEKGGHIWKKNTE